MKRVAVLPIAFVLAMLLYACAAEKTPASAPVTTETPSVTAVDIPFSTPMPLPTPVPTETPYVEQIAVIGAVGDITVDSRMLSIFGGSTGDSYSFEIAYQGMRELIDGVDLMCGNLETPLAGADKGYSGDAKTPNAFSPKMRRASYAFNAPDELAFDLKQAGFDFVSTANNHFSDRCFDGVLRTLDVLDQAGLLHAGTNRSEEERERPCVTEINGIRIGLLSACSAFNPMYDINLARTPYLINALSDQARIENDVRLCREAGAEFIVMFTHWDEEFATEPSKWTRLYAQWLLTAGVDAIIGSHPHVVQPIEYVTVERANGPYTGLVAYSLGNSMMRMRQEPAYAQLFLRLTVKKDASGAVSLAEAAYLPTFSAHYSADGTEYFEVLPAWAEQERIRPIVPGQDSVLLYAEKARRIVMDICGTEPVPVMEEACSKS